MNTMKYLLSTLLFSALIISFNFCSKSDDDDDDSNGNENTTTYNFSAKVDGVLFQYNAHYSFITNPSNSYSIAINFCYNDIWKNWSLQFFGETTGTYPFTTGFPSPGDATGSYSEGPTGSVTGYEAVSGSVIVSEIDTVNNTISGTFSFTGEDENDSTNTISVTEGTFTKVPESSF